jgi:hypothetical protein
MKAHRFCYHITNGSTRSALSCGTVTADSMESAAEEAARRSKLRKLVEEEFDGFPVCRWVTEDGKRRSVYVLHDPKKP